VVEGAAIKETILNLLTNNHLRLTPSDLERTIRRKYISAQRRDIRNAVCELVSDGRVFYTQHHSTTHLEINFNRPVFIGDRIILCPSSQSPPVERDRVIIKLLDGTAFGGGDHPTTRAMLAGLDILLQREGEDSIERALDIGTGTGVLAIAAAVLGISRVDAVDIDPVACHEARQNVQLNALNQQVKISQKPLDPYGRKNYDLVLANLRPPTIIELIPVMTALSSSNSIWIISGCRLDERDRLIRKLPNHHSDVIWKGDLTDWAAFAVRGAGQKIQDKTGPK